MQKDHFVAENIQVNIQLINLNILLGLSFTLICFTNDKSCSDRLHIVNSVLKAADHFFCKNHKSPLVWCFKFCITKTVDYM